MLDGLGNQLGRRYERTGKMEDLEDAINRVREAVAATSNNHPDRAGRLNNLGNKLESRTGKTEDLEEAIQRAREAVAATPEDHPNRAGWLHSLGNHLSRRYERLER